MKYLEEEKLNRITAKLTNATLGVSRVINGRIEAYTMKRAGTDKKYAHALGERYVAEIETMENELMMMVQKTSGTDSITKKVIGEDQENAADAKEQRKRSQSAGTQIEAEKPSKQQRNRASSFDVSIAAADMRKNSTKLSLPLSSSLSFPYSMMQKSPLGDFCESGTRRLMTDLILTLNASFPDYDFANLRPSDFEKMPVPVAVQRINQSLSELAATTKKSENFLADLWNNINSVINLLECDVYSYAPPAACCGEEEDPLGFLLPSLLHSDGDSNAAFPGTCEVATNSSGDDGSDYSNTLLLWSFNYFLVNKQKKRIVVFTCIETMQNGQQYQEEDDEEEFSYVPIHETASASNIDFDLDPAADVAGGIPIKSM